MKVTEYRVQYLCKKKHKSKWMNADFNFFPSAKEAMDRIELYKQCGHTLEYRVVMRTIDYGKWEEVK